MMEAVRTSETSVDNHFARQYNPEDSSEQQKHESRVSSVSIVSDYGLDNRAIGVRSPAGAKDFSSILCVQTGSGANQASCPMGTGGSFQRG
jgi:hypothetical protein